MLNSPYIVKLIYNFTANAIQNIVLEYCNCGNLLTRMRLRKDTNIPFSNKVIIVNKGVGSISVDVTNTDGIAANTFKINNSSRYKT